MIVQELYIPLSFSKKDNSQISIDQFVKEALFILYDASNSLLNPIPEETAIIRTINSSDDNDEETVTWQLNLTPTMMTLDTNISTISGLEKILELIRINVKPRPAKFSDLKTKMNIAQYDIQLFQQMLYPVLRLSTVMSIPRSDQLGQYNAMQMMRHFVQSFIDCGYSFFLDIPTLLANTEMILSQPTAAKEHTVETLLILSVCSLMCRHTTIHHRGDMNIANSLGYAYYSQARQLLQNLFDVHHIAIVQSLFILSLYPQSHNHLFSPARTKNALLTMSIRMALAMDLHKLDLQHQNESNQKEKLRRLAWMILCADYFSEWNTTGETGVIDVVYWNVDFPQPLPNEKSIVQIDYFSQFCRIVLLRKLEVFKSVYMVCLKSKKINLEQQFFSNFFNTPDKFKIDYENPNPTWSKSDTESLLLQELYCHTQIFAKLPFLPRKYVESFAKEEDMYRFSDINDIYQHITKQQAESTIPFTQLLEKTLFLGQEALIHEELEFHFVVNLLSIMNKYTLILEALTTIDTIGCHHSPVYGAILSIHLYFIIEKSCQDPQVRTVCQINLLRTQRILRQSRSIYADAAILFLDRMLTRHHIIPKEEVFICTLHTKTQEILSSLQYYNNNTGF